MEATRHAGWTILLSAFPVSIAFAALLTIPLSELRSVGFAGLTVTVFSLLLSVTLLPAVLSMLGRRSRRAPHPQEAPDGSRARLGGLAAVGEESHRAARARARRDERPAAPPRAADPPPRHRDAQGRLAAEGLRVGLRVPPARVDGAREHHPLAARRARPSEGRHDREPRGLGSRAAAVRAPARRSARRARAEPARAHDPESAGRAEIPAPRASRRAAHARPRRTAARRSTRSFRRRTSIPATRSRSRASSGSGTRRRRRASRARASASEAVPGSRRTTRTRSASTSGTSS